MQDTLKIKLSLVLYNYLSFASFQLGTSWADSFIKAILRRKVLKLCRIATSTTYLYYIRPNFTAQYYDLIRSVYLPLPHCLYHTEFDIIKYHLLYVISLFLFAVVKFHDLNYFEKDIFCELQKTFYLFSFRKNELVYTFLFVCFFLNFCGYLC